MAVSQTIGIDMPVDFPTAEHNSVHVQLARYRHSNPIDPIVWGEYAGGWNAVVIRFKTSADADVRFTASVTRYARPTSDQRQAQEEDLFTFFVAGFSSIESFGYACFAVCAMLEPTKFPMAPEDLQWIDRKRVKDKLAAHFPESSVRSAWEALLSDPKFRQWRTFRNVLAHRAAPTRIIGGAQDGATVWQIVGGVDLNAETTKPNRRWLASSLTTCVQAMESFVKSNFP